MAETSYGLARANEGSDEVWAQLRDEIEDNLTSKILLRHDSSSPLANRREILALCRTAETLVIKKDFFNDRLWRELEHQLLWKLGDAARHKEQPAFNEACGLAYSVVSRCPYPISKVLAVYVEEQLLA